MLNANDPPEISGTPATSVNEDSPYSFTPSASDPDISDSLTFDINNKPDWADFSTSTGSLTGTPDNGDVGTSQPITIGVSDLAGARATLAAFTITVVNTNDPPELSGSPANSVSENSPYSFTPVLSDPDVGDSHDFEIVNQPDWADFDDGTGQLSGTPAANPAHRQRRARE